MSLLLQERRTDKQGRIKNLVVGMPRRCLGVGPGGESQDIRDVLTCLSVIPHRLDKTSTGQTGRFGTNGSTGCLRSRRGGVPLNFCYAVTDQDKTCATQMHTLNLDKDDSIWKRRTLIHGRQYHASRRWFSFDSLWGT